MKIGVRCRVSGFRFRLLGAGIYRVEGLRNSEVGTRNVEREEGPRVPDSGLKTDSRQERSDEIYDACISTSTFNYPPFSELVSLTPETKSTEAG